MRGLQIVFAVFLGLGAGGAAAQDLPGRWTCDVAADEAGAFMTLQFGRTGSLTSEFRLALTRPRYGIRQIAGEVVMRYRTEGPDIIHEVQVVRIASEILRSIPIAERRTVEDAMADSVRESFTEATISRASDRSLALRGPEPFNGACLRAG